MSLSLESTGVGAIREQTEAFIKLTRFSPKSDLNSENLLPSRIRAKIDFMSVGRK